MSLKCWSVVIDFKTCSDDRLASWHDDVCCFVYLFCCLFICVVVYDDVSVFVYRLIDTFNYFLKVLIKFPLFVLTLIP